MPNSDDDLKEFGFKSPLAKLVKFFRKSRDRWKTKYMQSKYRAKLLSDQLRYWKEKSTDLKRRIEKLEEQLCESEKKTRKDKTQ